MKFNPSYEEIIKNWSTGQYLDEFMYNVKEENNEGY